MVITYMIEHTASVLVSSPYQPNLTCGKILQCNCVLFCRSYMPLNQLMMPNTLPLSLDSIEPYQQLVLAPMRRICKLLMAGCLEQELIRQQIGLQECCHLWLGSLGCSLTSNLIWVTIFIVQNVFNEDGDYEDGDYKMSK